MFGWSRFPFLRIAFFYIVGILIARWTDPGTSWEQLIVLCAISGAGVISILFYKTGHSWLAGFSLLICIAGLGFVNYSNQYLKDSNELPRDLRAYTGTIVSYPTQKGNYYQYDLKARSLKSDSLWITKEFTIRLYVKTGTNTTPPLTYGDVIAVSGKPFRIPAPKNPHEFDYSQYMRDQGILYQQFVKESDIKIISKDQGNALLTIVYSARNYFNQILNRRINGEKEKAVALALLLGKKDELDQETRNAFASAGAMHVLAVSGLHVGVIYLMMTWVFRRVKSKWINKILLPLLTILALWFYALLTGFSPSIFRSVVMFSVIILGNAFSRQANIYNSIAVSAFILLLVNPMNLFSVGFQLSYLAVIGIVFLYDKLYLLLVAPNWLLDKVWSISCISIAAQVATVPISIYYFNQLPTYFLFSNLLVIPMAFLIMHGGILLLTLGSFEFSHWIGVLLEAMIKILNISVAWIEALPYSTVGWVYLSQLQVMLLYLFIMTIAIFLFYRYKQFLWIGILLLLGFIANRSYEVFAQSTESKMIFYSTRENLLIDDIHGLNTDLLVLDSLDNHELAAYQIHPNRISNYLPPISQPKLIKEVSLELGDFALLDVRNGNRFLFLYGDVPEHKSWKLETDYLILCRRNLSSELIRDHIKFKELILNFKKSYVEVRRWKKLTGELGITLNDLRDKALVIQTRN